MGLFLFSSANVFAAAPNDQKEPVDPRLMVPIPDIKLNAPTFIPVNRSAQDIDITLEVDFFSVKQVGTCGAGMLWLITTPLTKLLVQPIKRLK